MKLILEVQCDVSNMPSYIDHAFVDLDPGLVKRLMERKSLVDALKKADDQLWEVSFWDADCRWLEGRDGSAEEHEQFDPEAHLPDELKDSLNKNCWVEVPDGFDVEGRFCVARSECDQLIVDEKGFRWKCIAKHTDLYYVASSIGWGLIEKVRNNGELQNQ